MSDIISTELVSEDKEVMNVSYAAAWCKNGRLCRVIAQDWGQRDFSLPLSILFTLFDGGTLVW